MSRKIWTYDLCKQEAKKYKTITEFQKKNQSAYNACIRNAWIEDVCSHMILKKKPSGYWGFDKCKQEASKYKCYKDFYSNCSAAVNSSRKNGWLALITSHFTPTGNLYKRFIYAYEFPDNHVYVGLTHNIEERKYNHTIKGSVFEYCQETNLQPKFILLTEKSVDVLKAKELESYYLSDYINNGWIKLNRRPTGAVGSTLIKWDYEACLKESMKYETRFDFMKNSKPAYNSCAKNGWLELIYENLPPVRKPPGFYSLDKCIELVKNVEKISHIKEEHPTALRLIYENGWKDVMKENVGLNIKNRL